MKPLLLFTFILLLTAARLQAQNVVKVPTPGSLASQLTQAQRDTCTQLTVQGKLNSADIRVLRQMAGYKEEGGSTGQLSTLNLADAEFVTDKEPYMVLDAKEEHLSIKALSVESSPSVFRMGEPFTERHKIHYENYSHQNWSDYSKYRWNSVGQVYVPRYELMSVYSQDVAYYHAKYILGSGNMQDKRPSREQFRFTSNIDNMHWKWLEKEHLTHIKGHRIVRDGDRYKLHVYSHKKFLPADMFHGCDRLKMVILPVGMMVDNSLVIDETSTIKYRLPYNKITIFNVTKWFRTHHYYPQELDGKIAFRHQKKTIEGADADELLAALNNLEPVKLKYSYRMDTKMKFKVEYADGRPYDEIYMDVDKRYVQIPYGDTVSERNFRVSKQLLKILHKHHIHTKVAWKFQPTNKLSQKILRGMIPIEVK